ncbi:MAG: hypothetical protein M1820_010924 [Bogoriella megaspora]|nr:MAG: hypothetical protein M1820_010924 [Bogoriella megaspora]
MSDKSSTSFRGTGCKIDGYKKDYTARQSNRKENRSNQICWSSSKRNIVSEKEEDEEGYDEN